MISKLVTRAYTEALILKRPEGNLKAAICFIHLPVSLPLDEIDEVLHPQEASYYNTLKFEKRKRSYLIGRYAAKQAIGAFVQEKDLRKILIEPGIFNHPVVRCGDEHNIQISITHCDELGAAIAFPEGHPMGIDIEKIDEGRRNVLESQMTSAEKELIKNSSWSYDKMLTLLWTVKEALSKTLKTGLMTPFHVFELNKIEENYDHMGSYFENFGQYTAISFDVRGTVCSIVYPKKTELTLDMPSLRRIFDFIVSAKEGAVTA